MRLARTERFKRAYQELTERERVAADKALRLLASNMRHPSLQVKKLEGTEGVWEARASRSLRLTFEVRDDVLILRNIGRHDIALKRP